MTKTFRNEKHRELFEKYSKMKTDYFIELGDLSCLRPIDKYILGKDIYDKGVSLGHEFPHYCKIIENLVEMTNFLDEERIKRKF